MTLLCIEDSNQIQCLRTESHLPFLFQNQFASRPSEVAAGFCVSQVFLYPFLNPRDRNLLLVIL